MSRGFLDLVRNADFTRKYHHTISGKGIHRNELVRTLTEYVCEVISANEKGVTVKRVTLKSEYLPSTERPESYHDQISVWEVDEGDWTMVDIHQVKNVKAELE